MQNLSLEAWQRQVLTHWATTTVALMQLSAAQKGLRDSGDLINSIGYELFSSAAGTLMGLEISFNTYGRILDMTRLKASPLAVNRAILLGGKMVKARKGATSKNWYSKVVYSRIHGTKATDGLFEQLSEGYAQWALEQMLEGLRPLQ